MILFNRKKIFKNTQNIQKKRPQHAVLVDAAHTILERFLWSSHNYKNILILGAYNYVFYDLLKKNLSKNSDHNIIVQYKETSFDSEYLPFEQNSFDCVFSFFDIQWINDVPGYLKQIQYMLKPQGLLSGVFLGGQTFTELKNTFYNSQMEMINQSDLSMNFMPTIHASDGASLLQRACFSNAITDRETKKYCLSWPQIYRILHRLHATGFMQHQSLISKSTLNSMKNSPEIDNSIELVFITALGTIKQDKVLNNRSSTPMLNL